MSNETHPDRGVSGQPYSAPRQAWGGNADPRNLSYEGARYFGPGWESSEQDVAWTPRTKTAAAQLRSVLRANLMDGDEGGSLTMRCSELLNEVCGLVVETWLPDIIASARADGIEEGRGDMEHLERKWRAEERERGAPARYAAYEALVHAERRCRYHDPIGDKLGSERGLPRCESCQQPYRVNSALDAIDRYTRGTS